ncbi:MAG: hypothetical protein EPN91_07540 [Salinibacterium sp.]|nr:MAG: hypothetical protein EPN91_07540 [Salinibacterium sp.]
MIPGETLTTGAAGTCPECGVTPELEVLSSPGGAGFYLGTRCRCGPYSRETSYFKTRQEADAALDQWWKGNRVGSRE